MTQGVRHGADHAHDRHDHAHHHGHSHGGGHAHAPASFGRAFAIGITLNIAFVIIEAVYGFASDSMAWWRMPATTFRTCSPRGGVGRLGVVKRAPTPRFTYGLRGSSILAALFNAVFLLVATGAIAWEAVARLIAPEPQRWRA